MTAGAASSPSLLDDARALTTRIGTQCGVDRFYISHPELAADLREALASEVQGAAIAAALKRRGIELSAETIQRHRRGACKCH